MIVIIGILASIAAVGYNGIQQRARNSMRVAAVNQAIKLVKIAATEVTMTQMRNSLNLDGTWYSACLGTQYPDVSSDGIGDCGIYNGTPYVSESANFNSILASWTQVPNMSSFPIMSYDGNVINGPFIESAWVDGRDMLVVEYMLEGEAQDCQLEPRVYYVDADNRTMTPSATPDYSQTEAGRTECLVAVYQ